jgi:hypothetical protein
MTGPQDGQDTRPISVAELLARNGSIGAPPVGGRRRRRRGNTEAVTVAELTGEIPVYADHDEHDDSADQASAEPEAAPEPAVAPERDLDFEDVSAEEMAPDPVDIDDEDAATAVEEHEDLEEHLEHDEQDDVDEDLEHDEHENDVDERSREEHDVDELPSYLQASPGRLFGGRTTHDGLFYDAETEVTELPDVPPKTTTAEDHGVAEPPTRAQQLARGALVVLQSILAVAFGAGLFIAFDQLWKWNNVVALVLSVLVILGLVAAVWVVRKTEDIASTLIAVAVGALVTMGPLVLHTN